MIYASFYLSILDELRRLPDDQFGHLVRCLLQYAETGEEPCDDELSDIATYFDIYKKQIDAQREAASDKSKKQSENAKKRWHKDDMPNDANACHGMPDNANACQSMPNDANDANININNKKKERISKDIPKKDAFRHPSLQEVTDYCAERRNAVNPSSFISYYDSVGWKVGKNPMKDWKAAVRTWEQRDDRRPPGKRMGANAGYEQHKISDAEFDALFESEGF